MRLGRACRRTSAPLVSEGVDKSNSPWVLALVLGVVAGICALLCFPFVLVHTWHAVKDFRVHRKRSGWSLSVGPDGITTTDAFRRTVAWEQVGEVSLTNIQARTRHRYTGLHVRFTADTVVPMARPAGWYDLEPAPRGKKGNVPLCVLGPMTEQQRFDLTNALIHHAGECWDAKADESP
ncbi:hypothetical protein [Streptomyces hesseae]|uniref:DUF3592 domain-containing protein n=1 Tax=Streptomyces hesseae TaxID=3075519 RepID=A0ABU2SIW8_9ACTN|nr:hypothetical protein [Streptomyces sp. DSM 40473]MDT0448339.1 hypothetical protein [Streptomyces sp. DSM 40473]